MGSVMAGFLQVEKVSQVGTVRDGVSFQREGMRAELVIAQQGAVQIADGFNHAFEVSMFGRAGGHLTKHTIEAHASLKQRTACKDFLLVREGNRAETIKFFGLIHVCYSFEFQTVHFA